MATALSIVKEYFPKVTKVNDASEDMQIEVTKRDNNHAKVRNHSACALAVACKRATGVTGVIVAVKTLYLVDGDTATRFTLPESASREIVTFDRDAPGGFDVGTYNLHRPSKSRKLGARESRNNKGATTGTGEPPKFRHITNGIRAALGSRKAPDGITRTHE